MNSNANGPVRVKHIFNQATMPLRKIPSNIHKSKNLFINLQLNGPIPFCSIDSEGQGSDNSIGSPLPKVHH